MKVPFIDIRAQTQQIRKQLLEVCEDVIDSGWFLQGERLSHFESVFAAYCDSAYCVGVGNGFDALQLILRSYGIGQGDEVIVPANTFIATWLAVSYCGATPVPVEPELSTYNIDASRIRDAITSHTKAVIPVHLYGQPANMNAITKAVSGYDVLIIEDAAQAHGALYGGCKAGSLGHAAAFSFYPAKNLGALGDAGAIVTSSESVAEKARVLGNYGSKEKYLHVLSGLNSRMDEMQAAFLSVKMNMIDAWNVRRREIADAYLSGLRDTSLVMPEVISDVTPVWHLFVVRAEQRKQLIDSLLRRGIEAKIHYPLAPHMQGAYADSDLAMYDLPITEMLQRQVVSLPIYPQMTDEQVEYVIYCCKEIVG